MLRITVESIPGGFEKHPFRKEIGRIEISNIGGDAKIANYKVNLYRRGTKTKVRKTEYVYAHQRSSQEVWRLLARALYSLGFKGED